MTDLQPPLDDEDVAVMRRLGGIAGWAVVVAVVWTGVLILMAQTEQEDILWRGWGVLGLILAVGVRLLIWSRAK